MSDAVHPNEAMSLKRATAWAALAQYSGFALQFIASVIIARYFLDPAEVGIFSVAFSAAALVHGLQDFGLNRFIVGAKELSDDTVRVTFTVSIAVAAFIVTVILLLAQPMADFFGNEALYTIALVIGISYVFIPFSVVPLAMVQRRMDFRGYAFVETGANLVQVVITIGAAWYGYSSLSLAFGVFAYQMAKAGLTQMVNPIFRIFPPSLDGSRRIFTYGGSSSLISFTASIATRAPDLIVGKMISEAALGLYGRATGLAVQFRVLVSGPVESVFYPSLSRARDRGEDISAHYLRLTSALCAVTWAAMFGLAMGAEPLVLALYGERWAGVAPVMVWVALAQIFFIAIPMQIDVGYLLGKWRTIVMLTMLDAALSIGLLYYAARFGLEWAAISRVAHGAIWWVIHAVFMQRLVGFSWRSLLDIYWRTFVAGLAAIAPLALGYAFWMAPDEMTFGVLALLSTLGVATWYAALIAIRHPSAGEFSDIVRHQREAFGRLRQRYT